MKYLLIALRLIPSIILLQTLFFKFSGHSDSVALFSLLGVEPYGRIGLGIIELIVAIMLIVPKTSINGSLANVVLMIGAIFTHLFKIGIVFRDDKGVLFAMAITSFVCSALFLFLFLTKRKPFSTYS